MHFVRLFSLCLVQGRKRGALFIGVCRGKLAEGIDFSDQLARGIIVVGVPFPNTKAPDVKLKRDHNEMMRRKPGFGHMLSGDQWYQLQAHRAINQSIGRVIRHRYDYGAVLLVDERFQQSSLQNALSKWVRNSLESRPVVTEAIASLKSFFEKWEAKPPGPPAYISPV
jgi:Fanconi anemia group J protein